jgi:hypothetical protein
MDHLKFIYVLGYSNDKKLKLMNFMRRYQSIKWICIKKYGPVGLNKCFKISRQWICKEKFASWFITDFFIKDFIE